MKFIFLGINFKSADREAISTDIDKFLKVLKNNREYRENTCRISARYTQFKVEDFSIEPTNLTVYVGANNALKYMVYFKDQLIGYTNFDFLYTGLMFKTSKSRQVSVAEWFDHILKADAYQMSEHYSLRLKGTTQIRYNPIESEEKETAYEWILENNRKALGEDVLEVLELLNSITTVTILE